MGQIFPYLFPEKTDGICCANCNSVMYKGFVKFIVAIFLISEYALSEGNLVPVSGKVTFQDETLHFEFSGRESWLYKLDKKEEKNPILEIYIDPIDLVTEAQITKYKSNWVKKIEVVKNQTDGKNIIKVQLSVDLDVFDYQMESPSRLMVDLYPKTTVTKKEPEKKPIKEAIKQSTNKRKPATADFIEIEKSGVLTASDTKDFNQKLAGIFDGADPFYERFKIKDYEINNVAIIKSQENHYIDFPNLVLPVQNWSRIQSGETVFEIQVSDSKENKLARLLQTLYEKRRYQVFLKTQKWFFEAYPNSEYTDIIQNMGIQIQLNLWKEKQTAENYDQAVQQMKELVQKNPKHPLAERYSLLLGILAFEKKDYFNSLRAFQNHTKNSEYNHAASFSNDLARLGVALSLQNLNQYESAENELKNLEKDSIFKEIKAEASNRIGDIHLSQKNFQKAIQSYDEAIKKWPEFVQNFPNSFYNRAQSYFALKQYKEGLEAYCEFIKKFPQESFTAYAMTRVGELLEILGANKNKVLGAYLETYFRNGDSPTAIVARLRILFAKMKSMKPKEVQITIDEILDLSKKSELSGIESFSRVLVADGYVERGEFDSALSMLIDYYQQNPTTVDKNLYAKRIYTIIYSKIERAIHDGKFIDALSIYNKYFDTWLKSSDRLDIKFQVGKAYEIGGVPSPAIRYYSEVLNRYLSIKDTQQRKEVLIKENIPSESTMYLRLAASESIQKNYSKSLDNLMQIKNPEQLNESEQIERILLATDLFERKGDLERATLYLSELIKYWKGQPERVAEPYFKLSQFEIKKGKLEDARNSLKRIHELMMDTELVDPSLHKKSLEQLAKLSEELKKPEDAIGWYEQLLEKYEEKFPLSSARYKLGQLHFKAGRLQKASEIWSSFKGENAESWNKIAKEQLRNSEWKDEYKKYLNRMPAMEKKE